VAAALDPKEMKGVVGVANEDAIQSKSDRLLHVNGAAVNELTSTASKRKLVSANGQSVQQFSAWCNTTEKSVC